MENSSKPTMRKKVISTFIVCSATFFALSCLSIWSHLDGINPFGFLLILPNILVGLLFGIVATPIVLISTRMKQDRGQAFRMLLNSIAGLMMIVVAIGMIAIVERLPRSTWQPIPQGPELVTGFVKLANSQESPVKGWLVRGQSGAVYQLDCAKKDCLWGKIDLPIPPSDIYHGLLACSLKNNMLWPLTQGKIVDWSAYNFCSWVFEGHYIAVLLDDGTLWHWSYGNQITFSDFVCWPIAAILTLVVCSALTSRKAGVHL